MKIVQVSTSDMGGAGIAARRLHLALITRGIASVFLTLIRLTENTLTHYTLEEQKPGAVARIKSRLRYHFPSLFKVPQHPLANKPEGYEYFSVPESKVELAGNVHVKQADLIHLHWVADGVLNYDEFFKSVNKPVVWTLHDMNPFTGGCHHSDGCLAFVTGCGECFQIKGIQDEHLAAKSFRIKENALRDLDQHSLVIVTPSQWLSQLSQKSAMFKRFRHFIIPNIIDEKVFSLRDKNSVRKELGIETHLKVILFVANDVSNKRKGIGELLDALRILKLDDVLVCTVGNKLDEALLNLPVKQFGLVTSETLMSKIYSASDVFVLPSHAENFPNTIVESLLCGTPVVASNVGGIPEQINKRNGILFDKGDIKGLANALQKVLTRSVHFDSETIHKDALINYSTKSITDKYLAIYSDLLKGENA